MNDHQWEKWWKGSTDLFCFIFPDSRAGGVNGHSGGGMCARVEVKCVFWTLDLCRAC